MPKRAHLREALEVLLRNFAGAIDLIGIDMFAQISFKLAQKLFASVAILGALCRIRIDSIEIVAADEQVAGETAAVVERIARGLSEFERLALACAIFEVSMTAAASAFRVLRWFPQRFIFPVLRGAIS